MKRIKNNILPITVTILLVVLLFSGCSKNRALRTISVESKMERANAYYDKGKYNRAAELYLDVVFERSSKYTPIAQFRLAESYFNQKRYSEATFEYQEFIRLFPEHSNVNIAYFRVGESYLNISADAHYSQKETVAALDAFDVFLDRFPFDENKDKALKYIQEAQYKLLKKNYYNGYIYYRLYDYSAALMYFDDILSLSNRDELDKKARYYSALIYSERKDKVNAEKMLKSLKEYYPDEMETAKIEKIVSRKFR